MSWTRLPHEPLPRDMRFQDLLVDRATEGLSVEQEQELCRLLLDNPQVSAGMLELPASVAQLAFVQMQEASRLATAPDAELPEHVDAGLSRAAEAFKAQMAAAKSASSEASEAADGDTRDVEVAGRGTVLPFQPTARAGASKAPYASSEDPFSHGAPAEVAVVQARAVSWSGWAAAAAAALIAAVGWWRPLPEPEVRTVEIPVEVPARGPELAEVRAAQDLIEVPWKVLEDPTVEETTSGEVLWSNQLQAGFMTFEGLAANDPSEFQYQLWIFDRNQDEAHPIDGGVFDVAADGTATVPIDAKLAVTDPTLFAITVEKPGGVVVSSRKRLALVAPVEQS